MFNGATLLPAFVCKDAINKFKCEHKKLNEEYDIIVERLKSEDHHYKILWVFKRKCTKWELVLSFRDWFTKISAMRDLGFVDGEFAKEVEYMNKKGYYAYRGVRELTNNGTRDAYLNPEQASFVNRWGK
jgi:hypothetical protein